MGTRSRRLVVTLALLPLLSWGTSAQTRYTYSRGQSVSPAYEGWSPNADGTYTLYFGYMNTNWEEELDVPIGPANSIEPGGPDQGQPTHFYPRRNMFLFTVQVAADFGDDEVVWTLTTNGKTERAYGSLRTDYQLDPQTIATEMGANFGRVRDEWRTNQPPLLTLAVDQPRRVGVGEPLALVAFASDDGSPSGEYSPPPVEAGKPHPAYTPPRQIVPGNPPGLRLSWIVYRGRRLTGELQRPAVEDLARHARVLQFAVVAALHLAGRARGREVGGRRDLRRARHVHAPRRRRRRRSALQRKPHRYRDALTLARPQPPVSAAIRASRPAAPACRTG